MSDFQKQTLKRYARNFLIVCGVALLVYGVVKFELARYVALSIMALTIAGACVWAMINSIRWDWQLRGKLTENEYKAYKACDWMFGWRDDKYLSTEKQIEWMIDHTDIPSETLWSMFEKLS